MNIEVIICEKTLYNYINSGLFLNINKSHLPHNKKNKLTKPKKKSIRKKGGRSIEERGEEINRGEEIGHWEMDTVGGEGVCYLVYWY